MTTEQVAKHLEALEQKLLAQVKLSIEEWQLAGVDDVQIRAMLLTGAGNVAAAIVAEVAWHSSDPVGFTVDAIGPFCEQVEELAFAALGQEATVTARSHFTRGAPPAKETLQ